MRWARWRVAVWIGDSVRLGSGGRSWVWGGGAAEDEVDVDFALEVKSGRASNSARMLARAVCVESSVVVS